MEYIVRVSRRGALTLPAKLRRAYGIQPGDSLRLVDLDGLLALTPMRWAASVAELAREIERARLDAGLSTESLLAGLQEQRERYYRETYAPNAIDQAQCHPDAHGPQGNGHSSFPPGEEDNPHACSN
jgi:AbrB family looped-hinge helix DNA binding protein